MCSDTNCKLAEDMLQFRNITIARDSCQSREGPSMAKQDCLLRLCKLLAVKTVFINHECHLRLHKNHSEMQTAWQSARTRHSTKKSARHRAQNAHPSRIVVILIVMPLRQTRVEMPENQGSIGTPSVADSGIFTCNLGAHRPPPSSHTSFQPATERWTAMSLPLL